MSDNLVHNEDRLKVLLDEALRAQGVISRNDAEKLIENTVTKTLLGIGISSSPESLIEAQKDTAFVRRWRLNYEKIEQVSWKTMIITILTGALALTMVGLKDWWSHMIPIGR